MQPLGITFIGKKLGAIGAFCTFKVNRSLSPHATDEQARLALSDRYQHIRILGVGEPFAVEDTEGQVLPPSSPTASAASNFVKR